MTSDQPARRAPRLIDQEEQPLASDPLSFTDKDGKTVNMILRITHGYRKIDGKWLIVHEHVSVPVDAASGKAVFESQ